MYDSITKILNNREIALFFWAIIGICWVLSLKFTREPIFSLIKAFAARQILVIFNLMIIWVELIVILFIIINLWDLTLLKDTIFWTFGVAFILLMTINKPAKEENFIKGVLYNNLKLIIVLQFISNLYVFNLATELVTIPILIFVGILSAFSELKEEYKKAKKIFDTILIIYGIIVMVFSFYNVIVDFDNFLSGKNLKSFFLSSVFTILYLPFVYLISLYIQYESFFVRIKWNFKDKKSLSRHIRWKIFLSCGFNLNKIRLVSKELKVFFIQDKTDFKVILDSIMKDGKHPIVNSGL